MLYVFHTYESNSRTATGKRHFAYYTVLLYICSTAVRQRTALSARMGTAGYVKHVASAMHAGTLAFTAAGM